MSPDVKAGAAGLAGRREYLGLAVLGLPTILLSLDMSVLFLAQPHLTEALGATSVQQLWISDIYGYVVSGLIVMMGALGDRVGRRKLLLIGGAGFAIASTIAAFSVSPIMLILMRALMGLCGATLMPSTMTLLRSMFPDPRQFGKAMGVWVACFMGGVALGPVVGGVLLQFFWWGSVFLLGLPVMAVLLILGPKLLPEYTNPKAGRPDVISAVLSLLAVLPVIYGLKELVATGVGAAQIITIVVGLIFGFLFVRRQNHLDQPMLDITLFRNKTFSTSLMMTIFAGLMAGTNFFVYQYLQTVEGLQPLYAALWLLPSTVMTVIGVQIAPIIAQRIRPAFAIADGLVLVAIGYLILTQLHHSGQLWLLVVGLVVSAIGIGPMGSLGASLGMGTVPMDKAGSAASMKQISGDFGIASGIALMGLIGTAIYQSQVNGHIPAAVPAGQVPEAKQSIAGATEVASKLHGSVVQDLLNSANHAFASALNVSALGSAILAVVLAILASTLLRHVPPVGQQAAPPAGGDGDETGDRTEDESLADATGKAAPDASAALDAATRGAD